MRALKIVALTGLLAAVLLGTSLAWLVRSEEGSRWLLEQGLAFSPVSIEASGISGTLDQGLAVESLRIALPLADIRVREIVISWSPGHLWAGVVHIDHASVAELSIDVLQDDSSKDPIVDRLFWLQIPLLIYVESGQLDKLRIEAAEFADLSLTGSIGHGRLDVANLTGQIAGVSLQLSGELTGPAPGRLEAAGSWQLPAANLRGAGSFSGDIEELAFTHVMNMPEAVNFNGSIYDLFTRPTLAGAADWSSVRLPGTAVLYSKAGQFGVSSDFRSARLQGSSTVLLEGWPEAPLRLEAVADLQGISIETYALEALGGQVTGSGRIEYGQGLQGQLAINGTELDASLINEAIVGRLAVDSTLTLESLDAFAIDVTTANGLIAGNEFAGQGRAQWREQKLTAVSAALSADTNRLSVDLKLGQQLAGTINADLPNLAMLWPGLQGALDADLVLGGSLEKPQIKMDGKATSLMYGSLALETLAVSGELQSASRLSGDLAATGLVAGQQQLGNLDVSLAGTLAEHRAKLKLAGDLVDVDLRTVGGWDGEQLTQRFEYGRVQPEGFDSWQLEQSPELHVSESGSELEAHCWKQGAAGICIDTTIWSADSLQSNIAINGFALATLQPLLAEGYGVDGTVDANLKIVRNSEGLRGELHWRQARTVLSYADSIDEFQTELNEVRIDLISDDTHTDFLANISGEGGLALVATAEVSGPLAEQSPVQASATGSLPSIGLLRPLMQRVVNPGELQGELKIDLDVGGTLGDPVFTGGAYLKDGVLGLLGAGITLTDINIAAESKASDKLLVTGQFRSGEGSAAIVGDVHSEANAQGDPRLVANISVKGENLASVRTPDLNVDMSPDLILRIAVDSFDISGAIVIPRVRAEIRDLPTNTITPSADVIVHAPERAVEVKGETIVTGNVEVLLGNDVRFKGFGLDSRLEGGLRLTQNRGGNLRTAGTVRVRDGFLTGYGKELRVDRGELTFTGLLDDPLINIQVSRESTYEGRQYTVGLRLTGSAQNVKTEPFSRPAMSDNDVLAFLLIDRPAGNGNDASGAAVALGLGKLMPGDGGLLGLDEVGFETNDANQAAMVAGKRINDDIYVRYVFGSLGEPGAFRIRYRLGKGFSLEASTGSGSQQSLDIIYMLER